MQRYTCLTSKGSVLTMKRILAKADRKVDGRRRRTGQQSFSLPDPMSILLLMSRESRDAMSFQHLRRADGELNLVNITMAIGIWMATTVLQNMVLRGIVDRNALADPIQAIEVTSHHLDTVVRLGAVAVIHGESLESLESGERFAMEMEWRAGSDGVCEMLRVAETEGKSETEGKRDDREPYHRVMRGRAMKDAGGGDTMIGIGCQSTEKGTCEAEGIGRDRLRGHRLERLRGVQVSRNVGLSANDAIPVIVVAVAAIAPQGYHLMMYTQGRLFWHCHRLQFCPTARWGRLGVLPHTRSLRLAITCLQCSLLFLILAWIAVTAVVALSAMSRTRFLAPSPLAV